MSYGGEGFFNVPPGLSEIMHRVYVGGPKAGLSDPIYYPGRAEVSMRTGHVGHEGVCPIALTFTCQWFGTDLIINPIAISAYRKTRLLLHSNHTDHIF